MRVRNLLTAAFICVAATAAFASQQTTGWLKNVQPTSYWGVRGLTQVNAAEPLGHGRLNVAFLWGVYQGMDLDDIYRVYSNDVVGMPSPERDSWAHSGRLSLAWGVSNYMDMFLLLPWTAVSSPSYDNGVFTGYDPLFTSGHQMTIGMQMHAPFPEEIPFRLAFHGHLVYGSGDNIKLTHNPEYMMHRSEIGENRDLGMNYNSRSYAGFDYWDARGANNLDIVLGLQQSMVAGNMRRAAKVHFNQRVAKSLFMSDDYLVMLGAGFQIDPFESMTLGFEANWRTPLNSWSINDPLWITPSMAWRSPYYANGLFGISWIFGFDIPLSPASGETYELANGTRVEGTRSLQSFRGFMDLVLAFDIFASRRAEMERAAREAAEERERLRREASMSAAQRDSVARQARADSLRLAQEMAARARADSLRAQFVADSLANLMGQQEREAAEREAQLIAQREAQRIADSIAMAEQRIADSIAMAQRRAADSLAAAEREAQLRGSMEEIEARRVADSIEAARRLEEERSRRSEAEQRMLNTGMLELEALQFASGSAVVDRGSGLYLTQIARMLVKYPDLRIEIGGHTDSQGRLQANMDLSARRAEAARAYMVRAEPALANMLTYRGYGPTVPIADNNTAEGRQQNRRVELRVLNPEVLERYR